MEVKAEISNFRMAVALLSAISLSYTLFTMFVYYIFGAISFVLGIRYVSFGSAHLISLILFVSLTLVNILRKA